MKQKKIPARMCLGCQEMKPKRELLRVVRGTEGDVSVDTSGKKPGRGAYICSSLECLEKAIKQKKFERAFETKIQEDIFVFLREELGKRSGK